MIAKFQYLKRHKRDNIQQLAQEYSQKPSKEIRLNIDKSLKINSFKWTILTFILICQNLISTVIKPVNAGGMVVPGKIEGVGYREPDLQVPKTTFFISENPQGISYASFNGGTNIFIKSFELHDDPQTNQVVLHSNELNIKFQAPLLSEDDTFNSHPMLGFITYRLPSLTTLMGVSDVQLAQYQYLSFQLSISTRDSDLNFLKSLNCPDSQKSYCLIQFRRSFTPVFYYLQPPVVYYQSITSVIFDPRSTQGLNIDLPQESKPFTNAKIGGFQIDFSGYVDETSYFAPYYFPNAAMGQVGQIPPNQQLPVSFLWEDGYASVDDQRATFCSFDNSSCYMSKIVPVIFGLSQNMGYISGGQNLSIEGFGFMGGNISVTVAGQPCQVSFFTNTIINCQVSPSANVSNQNGTFIGSNGLRRSMFNGTKQNFVSFNSLKLTNPNNQIISNWLALQMETSISSGNYYGNILQGWFIPPATSSYRFYMACDDQCILKLGNTQNDASNLTTILSVYSHSNYRDFWKTNDGQQRISAWVNLTQGLPYYIEANHIQHTGGDHFSVAVEIQQNQTVGHFHSMREIQQLTIQLSSLFDTVSITVNNPDNGTFQIIFQNPSTNLYSKSDVIPANANANQLRDAVRYYYSFTFGSGINVTMQMFDSNGDLTTNATNSTKNVYNITMLRTISGKSSSNLIVSKISTKSGIQIGNIQLSSPPLSGSFIVQCTDPQGKTYNSQSIGYNEWYMTIQYKIMNGCPFLYDKIQVFEATTTVNHENGRNFLVRFYGINSQPGYLNIINDPVNPLKGNNITFLNSTIQPYSTNLFYEPIPFEMLQTFEQEPQVIVNVNGLPATCHNLTCDFAYVQTVGQVQSFTFDQATSLLTLNGIDMPQNISMIQQINFALTQCKLDSTASISPTQIQCYLAKNATCGSFVPNLYSIFGLIPNTDQLSQVLLPCFTSNVFPNQYINIIGGDNLTFVGQYFPTNLTTSNITIQFGDAQQTQCIPTQSSYGYLSCTTNQFDQTVSLGQNYTISININGYSIQNSLSVLLNNFTTLGNVLVPNSVSPVLKQKLVLYLQNNFLYSLQKKDFTAMIVNSSDSTKFKILNVVATNDSAKSLTFMYGGSWSGQYNLVVRHSQYGLINTKGLLLTVGSNITSISPNVGSIYGGSLITITGNNYGNEITDNPIQISYNGGVGSTDCFVQSTNATTITCLVDNTISNEDGKNATVVVFLKLSEESICQLENKCQFTFTENVPTVTSLTVVYDSDNSQYQVVVQGDNFEGDTTSVYLLSQGIKQPTLSVTYNRAVFQVQNISANYGQIDQMSLYFPIGTPANHSIVTQNYSITPKLMSITPNNGSIAGSVIVANIQGVGTETIGLQLIDQTGLPICQQINITQYGNVVCQTFAKNITSQLIRISYNSQIYTCANPTSSLCQYQQLPTDSFPSVTSISISNPTVTLEGQNFITSGYTAKVQLAGVNADSVEIVSSTQIQATWNMGIPPLSSSLAPNVSFLKESSQVQIFAQVLANITNTLTVTQSTQGLQCSFAGGCLYQVTSPGLSTLLSQNQNKNYLSVCENKCVYQPKLSNSSVATCMLSSMSTLYSNQNFMIQSTKNLNSGVYFGTGKGFKNAFDGSNNIMNNDTSRNCSVGMQFRQGYVAILSQVKFFLSASDTANYRNGNLIFQGSMDGVTFTDIYTVDDNVHGGWNYQKWNKTLQNGPKFRFYRFFGLASGSCLINEIVLTGVETVQDQNTTYNCAPQLYINGNVSTQSFEQVTYSGSLTPLLTSITPRFGKVEGGENISFAGTGFSSQISDYNIIIDGINCPVFAATSTLIQCTTGPRPGLVKSSLQIQIANQGLVSLQDLIFQYVSYWSSESTWGGEFQPMEGESVNIPPGLNLYVDVDSTPVLNLVLVQGSLIFAPHIDPKHQRFFDAKYIFVNGGYMEVGTEAYPYTSKLTITMHGQLSDPYIPIYGNKCIGLRYATLEMHGPVRQPTWTLLQTTAYQNQSQITLNEAVDWQVGEEIVIASTDYDMNHAETFFIVSIDRTNINNPVLTLDKPLVFTHFAKTENYGGVDFDIRAEVGLLSRNVVFRGDPETSAANQYGAIIFMHSMGDDSIVGKISHIELKDVGQAFKVGRYPIHFHMVGNVMQSYAVGNSIHDSNNRAITIHGVHYLTITDNVAYNIKGHSIFMEDAIESRNFLKKNLVINTHQSWSLLNTDTTPANFWITFPDNDFIGNHAAGSARYGFWFDSKEHSTGPSASIDVCPTTNRAGLFINNTAHSAGRYGLRVFHEMTPLTYPCQPIWYDSNYLSRNKTDPYWKNPPILTNVDNFTGWKCGRNGAIAETMGNVNWNNFKVADNLLAGIEFSLTDKLSDNMPRIFNATVVGRTNNSEQIMFNVAQVSVTRGIITPRTENFTVDSVKFYYFDWNGSAALGGCSHCFHPASTDSGARTVTFKNTYFDSTVVQRIRQQEPWRHIYYDLDGTLTGKGPNTYYTYGWKHNQQPECDFLPDIYDGVVCNSSVQVRRLAFWNWLPSGVFIAQVFNILKWDDNILASVNASDYIKSNNYSIVPFKDKQRPSFAWAVPFVTGHKYKISWGSTGIDFTQMQVDQSEKWQQNDLNIILVHNFSMVRQAINVTVDNNQVLNNTLPSLDISNNLIQTGQNLVFNDSSLNANLPPAIQTQFITAFNGRNMSGMDRKVIWKGIQCLGACNDAVVIVPLGNITYWSDPNSWTNRNKTLPKDGDTVVIESGMNMILDINSPNLTKLTINGRLTFLNTTNITLTSGSIFVYAGELFIGSQDYPYKYNAKIQLEGGRFSTPIAFDGEVEGGNKILANVGTIKMYGIQRKYLFRLQQPAIRGSNQFYIDTGLDLVQGDQLGLLPTSYNHQASDQAFVQSYNNITGLVTINTTLRYYHWGANMSTSSKYNGVDIRGEVVLLTRNIQIIGSPLDGWGGQVVTSSTVDANMTTYNGITIMDSVEISGCSQSNTLRAALRFDGNTGGYSTISNSSIRNGQAWGLQIINSKNIYITDMVLFGFTQIGANLQSVTNITVRYSVIGNIIERVSTPTQQSLQSTPLVDKRAGITVCGYLWPKDKCYDTFINNNIVAGAPYAGFVNPAQKCGDTSTDKFFNNIAHSIKGAFGGNGVQIFADTATNQISTCYQASTFIAYKCWFQGAFSYDIGNTVIFKNMTMIDNRLGLGISMGNATNGNTLIILNDNILYGESEIPDCPDNGKGGYCESTDKAAVYPGQVSKGGQTVMQSEIAHLPVFYNHFDTVNSNSRIVWNRNKFFNFKGQTKLKRQQSIIGFSEYSYDYTPMLEFYDTQFTDVEDSAMAKLMSPLPQWANIEDCGNFPCTGPYNLLFSFKNTEWYGTKIDNAQSDFQIIPNNPGLSPHVQNCQYKQLWNGYYCNQNSLSILLFQSQDSDRLDRAYQPINITQYGTRVKNVLNAMMDHGWDGFYTSHKRVPLFPALLDAPLGSIYNISYTSTPPKNQQFQLISSISNTGLTVRIAYPDAVSYAVYLNGAIVEMNQWQTSINQYGPIRQRFCGENRYIGVQNILEFFITGNCTLQVKPRDAIQSMVRMEWTMSKFYSNGGTTKFADRLCAALGIHASQVKVVSVYEGSLVVNYNIVQDPASSQSLAQINQLQTQALATGSIDLGAPILDASSSLSVGTSSSKPQSIIKNGVVTAGGFTPISINSQSSSTANQPKGVYIPDVPIIQQQQTIYRNVSVQVVTSSNQSTPDIIVSNQPSDSESSKSWIAIPIVLGIFFIIVVLVGVKWYVNMKKVKESDLQAIKAAKLRQQELAQYNSTKKLKGYDESTEEVFSPEKQSKNRQKFQEVSRSSAVEEYGQQYDPNNDFAIFGVGDKTKGGIQSLKEKMNLADVVEDEEISSEDEKQVVPDEKTFNQSQSASNQNSDSPQNSEGNSKSKPTTSQTVRKPNPQSEQNNMPENQEIYEL